MKLHPLAILSLCFFVGVLYYFSFRHPESPFDYTLRISEAMLIGRLGLVEIPPPHLNEMVPHKGLYYSVFPLGAVLTMMPLAILRYYELLNGFPAPLITSLIAAGIFFFALGLAAFYLSSFQTVLGLSLLLIFGTWAYPNLVFGGAWQLALGFSILGQLGALYFLMVKKRPFLAGFFFALAFGNRTELITVASVFVYLAMREGGANRKESVAAFCVFPIVLGFATLAYNYARFASVTDFGYARIPGVLKEPWYLDGIFALSAIPRNVVEMLFRAWRPVEGFPYFIPTGFGGSILLSCPYLLILACRFRARNRDVVCLSWAAIILLTFVLWCHGNPGGWQYSYRYAMVLLPWFFLLLLETMPKRESWLASALMVFSFVINPWATYLFHWTNYVRP